jgi:hypothetical protein
MPDFLADVPLIIHRELHFMHYGAPALLTEHVSMDTKMNEVSTEIDSWKRRRLCEVNRRFRGYRYAI